MCQLVEAHNLVSGLGFEATQICPVCFEGVFCHYALLSSHEVVVMLFKLSWEELTFLFVREPVISGQY